MQFNLIRYVLSFVPYNAQRIKDKCNILNRHGEKNMLVKPRSMTVCDCNEIKTSTQMNAALAHICNRKTSHQRGKDVSKKSR